MNNKQFKKDSFKNGALIPAINDNDLEIPLQEVTSIAFDANTPDDIAKHYQDKLKARFKMINEDPEYWHRVIFLEDIKTGKLQIWFD
jgi:hypothetical protein